MNKSDLIATLAAKAKENLTENQATETINPIFNVELNADEQKDSLFIPAKVKAKSSRLKIVTSVTSGRGPDRLRPVSADRCCS